MIRVFTFFLALYSSGFLTTSIKELTWSQPSAMTASAHTYALVGKMLKAFRPNLACSLSERSAKRGLMAVHLCALSAVYYLLTLNGCLFSESVFIPLSHPFKGVFNSPSPPDARSYTCDHAKLLGNPLVPENSA